MSEGRTVWVIRYDGYEPMEVDSIWTTEEGARARREMLGGSMWEVEEVTVRRKGENS